MSMKHRLERLEGIHQPAEEPRHVFEIVHPPKGLTHEQEEQWREEHRRDCEARGVYFFTLDLSSGGAGLRDLEP
jgi:hypothetical protein